MKCIVAQSKVIFQKRTKAWAVYSCLKIKMLLTDGSIGVHVNVHSKRSYFRWVRNCIVFRTYKEWQNVNIVFIYCINSKSETERCHRIYFNITCKARTTIILTSCRSFIFFFACFFVFISIIIHFLTDSCQQFHIAVLASNFFPIKCCNVNVFFSSFFHYRSQNTLYNI